MKIETEYIKDVIPDGRRIRLAVLRHSGESRNPVFKKFWIPDRPSAVRDDRE